MQYAKALSASSAYPHGDTSVLFPRIRALEPQCDHGAIDARLKKVHSCGVSKNMGRDLLAFERVVDLFGNIDVLGYETLDRISAKSATTNAGKNRTFGRTVAFSKPSI